MFTILVQDEINNIEKSDREEDKKVSKCARFQVNDDNGFDNNPIVIKVEETGVWTEHQPERNCVEHNEVEQRKVLRTNKNVFRLLHHSKIEFE